MLGLEHSAADVSASIFVDEGLGTDPEASGSWPIYVNKTPDQPDNIITVRATQGTDSGRTMPDGEVANQYGIQVAIRGLTETVGRAKANAIRNFMMGSAYLETIVIDGHHYLLQGFVGIGEVLHLGADVPAGRRELFTINARCVITQID